MKRVIIFLIVMMAGFSVATAQSDFNYKMYEVVLAKYVDEKGLVNYGQLSGNPIELNFFLDNIAALAPSAYDAWTSSEQLAFWINVYNAGVLKVIADNYPIEASFFKLFFQPANSIRQLNNVMEKVTFRVMGTEMTLNHIHHEVLRKEFKDPRIHLALNGAALGFAPLSRRAYVGPTLDQQLTIQTQLFLNNPNNFRIDANTNSVYVSELFKWYSEDFEENYRNTLTVKSFDGKENAILTFIAVLAAATAREFLQTGDYTIEYIDFDWTLNDQK